MDEHNSFCGVSTPRNSKSFTNSLTKATSSLECDMKTLKGLSSGTIVLSFFLQGVEPL